MPGGGTEWILVDAFQKIRGVDLEDPVFVDGGRFEEAELGVFQERFQGLGKVLQSGSLGEVAPAAEAGVVEDSGGHGRTSA
jgi:hypothetical protein